MGMMGVSMSMNGYSYVHGNPINLTDPSGEHPAVVAAAVGAGVGALLGGGADIAMQMMNGTPIECINWRSVGKAALHGAIIGAVGGAVAVAIPQSAGLVAAFAITSGADFVAGTAADMMLYDMSLGEAAKNNIVPALMGGAIGTAAGVVGRAVAKSPVGQAISDRIGRSLGEVDNALLSFSRRFDTNAVTMGGLPVPQRQNPSIRSQRDAAFRANVSDFRKRGFHVPGGEPTMNDLNVLSELLGVKNSTDTISILYHPGTDMTYVGLSGANPHLGTPTMFGAQGWPPLLHAEADVLHQLYNDLRAGAPELADVPPGRFGDASMFVDLPACTYCMPGPSLFPSMQLAKFGTPQVGQSGSIFAKASGDTLLGSLRVDTLYYSLEVSGMPPAISNVDIYSDMLRYPPQYANR